MKIDSTTQVDWTILGDTEYIQPDQDHMKYPEEVELKKDIDFGSIANDKPLAPLFFEHFFPSVEGHAKKMDEFFADINAPYHVKVKEGKVKFHDPDAPDPDWIIKQAYLLMIAAATEADVGVDNLWLYGKSGGRRDRANFGQYMPKLWFKCFLAAAPYMFCDKEHWFKERREKPWEIFSDALDSFNEKRVQLFKNVLAMMDETMSGWRPKTSKTGGLPNISFEPRKPVPLGTMLRNAVECMTGCLIH
ncbi:hypothetical protein SEMRO_2714_G335340.1 [Seminavis robusta]|uniref:Uncharacterized protein n=1 Tax=Seminavis robusta TaxID=568900 RepID=A0A9N8F123_9STRA|nr:hypothetical protein SEMRO_2714_G335340.1 [Seminavis robusta]|eukprot:Sro2714_g335340.1 n/a (247) ;mRNA; f:9559-10299